MSSHHVAGIAAGDDPALEEKYKLPILTKGDLGTRMSYAGAWAYATFADMPPDARKLLTSGAMACVRYGLCGFVELDKDGDWREEATARSEFTQLPPKDTYSSESLHSALDIILATKVHWWLQNCHTGSTVMIALLTECQRDDFRQAVHIMGHWASTMKMLSAAGVKGLRTFTSVGVPGEKIFSVPSDAKALFNHLPAGTSQLARTYNCAVNQLESLVEGFIFIPDKYTMIKETYARYHIQAEYLTGKTRADADNLLNEGYLEWLHICINSMIPKLTLASSPHFVPKVPEYRDCAMKLAMALFSYRRDVDANPREALMNLLERIKAVQEQQDALGVPSPPCETKGKGDEAEEVLKKQIQRIDIAVQKLRDILEASSAQGESKEKGDEAEKVLKKQIQRIDNAVKKMQDLLEAPSAPGKLRGSVVMKKESLEIILGAIRNFIYCIVLVLSLLIVLLVTRYFRLN